MLKLLSCCFCSAALLYMLLCCCCDTAGATTIATATVLCWSVVLMHNCYLCCCYCYRLCVCAVPVYELYLWLRVCVCICVAQAAQVRKTCYRAAEDWGSSLYSADTHAFCTVHAGTNVQQVRNVDPVCMKFRVLVRLFLMMLCCGGVLL